jgi:hypothetical protein
MAKPAEYEWHAVRVAGGDVTGFTQPPLHLGIVSAPSWLDAMQRAKEQFGGDYGGLAVIAR